MREIVFPLIYNNSSNSCIFHVSMFDGLSCSPLYLCDLLYDGVESSTLLLLCEVFSAFVKDEDRT